MERKVQPFIFRSYWSEALMKLQPEVKNKVVLAVFEYNSTSTNTEIEDYRGKRIFDIIKNDIDGQRKAMRRKLNYKVYMLQRELNALQYERQEQEQEEDEFVY